MRDRHVRAATARLFCVFICAALLALPGLLGCSDDKGADPRHLDPLPQSSPLNCLAILHEAYIGRDYERYRALFTDDFVFTFDPSDVTNPNNPTPPQWGLEDELDSTQHMFSVAFVEKIELAWAPSQPASSEDEFPGTWKAVCQHVTLQVHTRLEDGTQYIYQVSDATEAFYFKQSAGERASDGSPLWRICRWEDQGAGNMKGSPPGGRTTWGMLKSLFLLP